MRTSPAIEADDLVFMHVMLAEEVRAVAEFMLSNIASSCLVDVASGFASMPRSKWGGNTS